MENPPAADSPRHMLHTLNDDCITEIMRHLRSFEDFLNVAQVCRRFQRCAAKAQYKFESLVINTDGMEIQMMHGGVDNAPLHHTPMVLQIFGHLITSIVWKSNVKYNLLSLNEDIFESIVKFCRKILKELVIYDYTPKDRKRKSFEVLERLELSHKELIKWNCEENLWFIRQIPSLKEFSYKCDEKFTIDLFAEFLSINPQLEILTLFDCFNMKPIIIETIGMHATNLRTLRLNQIDRLNGDILHLKTLRQLSELQVDRAPRILDLLLNMFDEYNIPINSLSICVMAPEAARNAPTLETLKRLTVKKYSSTGGGVFDELLINLATSQTALEFICIYGGNTFSGHGLASVLEIGRNLKEVEFKSTSIEVNIDFYYLLLNLVNDRVKVKMFVEAVDVPRDILDANWEWLEIHVN